ncbi:hypothetical protein BHE74_00005821 [Ensete ventricosum]|nr:hypothetical protein BHE74_00005821 [Ensete ventricosum]
MRAHQKRQLHVSFFSMPRNVVMRQTSPHFPLAEQVCYCADNSFVASFFMARRSRFLRATSCTLSACVVGSRPTAGARRFARHHKVSACERSERIDDL